MTEIVTLTEKFGPWIALLLSSVYIAANKMWPQWLTLRREEKKLETEARAQDHSSLVQVYERFIAQQAETLRFIASATEAVHSFVRSLDSNTQQLYRLSQVVERGPNCPLPQCPFMNKGEAHEA